jgi:SAM-dependent methyltransferase
MQGRRTSVPLANAYANWRTSDLGRITDALERDLILELAGDVTAKTLLDAGCGDGAISVAFARRGAMVTAIDLDPEMVAATRQAGAREKARIHVVQADARKLPFADAVFEWVIASALLCLAESPEATVTELARVLTPGGRLVLGDLGRWNAWAAFRRLRGWLGHPIWRRATFHTIGDLRELVVGAGLQIIDERGAVYYPPLTCAARRLAMIDSWLGRTTMTGAAFIAISATKPVTL